MTSVSHIPPGGLDVILSGHLSSGKLPHDSRQYSGFRGHFNQCLTPTKQGFLIPNVNKYSNTRALSTNALPRSKINNHIHQVCKCSWLERQRISPQIYGKPKRAHFDPQVHFGLPQLGVEVGFVVPVDWKRRKLNTMAGKLSDFIPMT